MFAPMRVINKSMQMRKDRQRNLARSFASFSTSGPRARDLNKCL